MRAGRLRHRITFERDVATAANAIGELLPDWRPFAKCIPAEVVWANGLERDGSDKVGATAAYQITIRYRDDLRPDDRIIWEGITLHIESYGDRRGRKQELTILATEKK